MNRKSFTNVFFIVVGLFVFPVGLSTSLPEANAQTLVIQGGTLIDGTGRSSIENSIIIIEGDRFKAVGRSGQVAIPAGSQIIERQG